MSKGDDTPDKARRPLNTNQLDTLRLIYRFRFVTTELIAHRKNKKRDAVTNAHMRVLYEQGYIGRHYDSSYKLQGKHAAYYLLPKGLAALKEKDDSITSTSKTIYNDRKASDRFIEHSLAVFSVACTFQRLYDGTKQFFAKTELATFDYFPQPMPDGYLSIKQKNKRYHFFVDIYTESTPMFVHIRTLKRYITYDESGEWDVTESDFPSIMVICDTKSLKNRLMTRIQSIFEEEAPHLVVLATTVDELLNSNDRDDRIWSPINSEDFVPRKLLK